MHVMTCLVDAMTTRDYPNHEKVRSLSYRHVGHEVATLESTSRSSLATLLELLISCACDHLAWLLTGPGPTIAVDSR